VHITISEVLPFPVEQLPVLRAYPEFEDVLKDRPLAVYSLNEIASEKVVALQHRARNEPRDLYDLWFLTTLAGTDWDAVGAGKVGLPSTSYRIRQMPLPGPRS
jgi:hypothetical protein